MKNLELKLKLPGHHEILPFIPPSAEPQVLHQRDTYYQVRTGRMKIREIETSGNHQSELIFYDRIENGNDRWSTFQTVPLTDVRLTKQFLDRMLGVRQVVEKTRTVFIWEDVRIHLDSVVGLGDFLELEAIDHGNPEDTKRRFRIVSEMLGCDRFPSIPNSYIDLLLNANERSGI